MELVGRLLLSPVWPVSQFEKELWDHHPFPFCPVLHVVCLPSSDPYAWGDMFPSCHPLLEEHHSPINLDQHATRNVSLGPLHLEGFDVTQSGHWTLKNDGHSGEYTADPFLCVCVIVSLWRVVLATAWLWFARSRAAGRQWDVRERWRSSRCVPHHPAALPLGGPGHQRLRAHGGRTQIPDGGTVRSVGSCTLAQSKGAASDSCRVLNVSLCCLFISSCT